MLSYYIKKLRNTEQTSKYWFISHRVPDKHIKNWQTWLNHSLDLFPNTFALIQNRNLAKERTIKRWRQYWWKNYWKWKYFLCFWLWFFPIKLYCTLTNNIVTIVKNFFASETFFGRGFLVIFLYGSSLNYILFLS